MFVGAAIAIIQITDRLLPYLSPAKPIVPARFKDVIPRDSKGWEPTTTINQDAPRKENVPSVHPNENANPFESVR